MTAVSISAGRSNVRVDNTGPALAQALLAPRSIALIGASDDVSKTSARPLQYLRRAGYEGSVYPINPRRDTILGERAWSSLADLPSVPDHAFILTPTEGAVEAAAECARVGVRVATILASGFSEGGEQGQKLVVRLQRLCADTGLRILGPSSLGAINLHHKTIITANAAFAEPDLPRGGMFVASHSGSLLGGLISRGKARNIGFAGLVSVGNEVDLSLGEICSATLDDPAISGYVLFLESIRHAQDLRRFALDAAARGKPIVAYKLGRSAAAAELALSHTGALAGEDDVADAFLADCGIARVFNFETLLESLPLLQRLPARPTVSRSARVGVVTTTGGGAAMVVDELSMKGIDVVKPSDATFSRLGMAGVKANHERITDLTLAGTRYDVMKAALETMLSAPEFDAVIAVIGSSARFQPELAVKPVIDSASSSKPLVAFLVPEAPQALNMLADAGVPNFRTPESCADAVSAALLRRQPTALANPPSIAHTSTKQLDEMAAYALLGRFGVPHAPTAAVDVDTALPIALPFEYPVAVKLLSADIAHKTEVGGVVLNVGSEAELRAAMHKIAESVKTRHPEVAVRQVLVQPMTSGLGEMLLGYRVDPEAGPIVLLAAGGIYTEIYRDRSIRLAPVDLDTARDMISELSISRIFQGFRNNPPGDIDALAQAVVAMSQLAADESVVVVDAEINPLIVKQAGEGVMAVDALVALAHGRTHD
ncbi:MULTISPECIES: acetate--CoA ligase family protein [unclassified Bradyrhizobium]|uniref:acetate--CoA ligase family protein n=1 Tax=unclassified Bradyrhizobium TaxID=2631580 RepID=UPI00185E949B|nr:MULTISPECIES: acetate--CoA ligase family protein [unclassified Bradyrhizobium]MBB4260541.1 acyl-CoA synthetase (NDP forming) [Bradyrhizobium sp. CIR3A]NYG46811.1 acyl-CoA synthetase (NDP forming) [Bradyrhizobium sp. IAR9]